ncbi:MAG: hypothetical protein J0I47_14295 [Sphingomonas sp.]|uniref:hypothetical protein n=1 Tax=Sphingomonas sp. TaxID=28214 RepID=UPI001AD58611|nr:hypothetical protein [Sphingomonas sp.]MBN8809388.1 hypothetical protein [Sphingomonas sp.]
MIAALKSSEIALRPPLQKSAYWDAASWRWFTAAAPRLLTVFEAMRNAGFAAFHTERFAVTLNARAAELQRELASFNVIGWQEKVTGRTFDPQIDIVLLHFVEPHGVRVQGQRFLQSPAYSVETTVRIAAHEMLHPPVPMDGTVAKGVVAALTADPLFLRIAKDHDPQWATRWSRDCSTRIAAKRSTS